MKSIHSLSQSQPQFVEQWPRIARQTLDGVMGGHIDPGQLCRDVEKCDAMDSCSSIDNRGSGSSERANARNQALVACRIISLLAGLWFVSLDFDSSGTC